MDAVSLFKAPQRGLGETQYAEGYKPNSFPGEGAYFAKEKEIADSYAKHYGEGVIETRVPTRVYRDNFAQHEMKYLGTPPGTELAIPSQKLDHLSQFEGDMAPMSIQVPRRVHGTVTRHEPYGCYIDFGEASDGLVVITMIAKDDEEVTFPPVGSSIEAVLLGYTEIGHQPRLSLRAEDFMKAKSGWEQ